MGSPVGYKKVQNQVNEARKAKGFFQPSRPSSPTSGGTGFTNGPGGKGRMGRAFGQKRRISIEQMKLCARCGQRKQ
eukprot:1035052-Pyramimonas_sp.AAC.1